MDIAIIGGGAAGFMAAIVARRTNPASKVTIFERAQKVLAKVEITGGGRCNVTNSFAAITDMKQAYPRGHKLMKRLMKTFSYEDTYRWFEQHGVPLVTQEDECVFPKAQDSHAIINCLVRQVNELGVTICCRHHLVNIHRMEDGRLKLEFENGSHRVFHRTIITTGGSPNGRGLQYLAQLGHDIEPPVPSLFTFNIKDRAFCDLMGTVVEPVVTTIPGTKLRAKGPLLVTHWGVSGPAVLKLSSYAARLLAENDYKAPLAISWTGELTRQEVEENLLKLQTANPRKQVATLHPFGLPSRLWVYILSKLDIDAVKPWAEIGRKTLNRMIETLVNDQYTIACKGDFRDEFVTCGGVSLSSVNSKTLESKVCPNLFFAGEVLDIDAITGGFNLQAAWTTGVVAGQCAAGS
ncbi:NAD(P)/FAD-dependent oxidoreductase [Prevotella melaninogenica]|uniref:Flavoprotein n=1 Tax=Prevotella melaninogenica DNF00666 TaxID=1401073 RepID=A0A096BMF5_9BACT|nr:NAD(P)/FAD-dependent oxidoreductase [Prevotella melaninogenica]KGF43867.1 flavoprotein [Prevotella melaninogenica DNF00666]